MQWVKLSVALFLLLASAACATTKNTNKSYKPGAGYEMCADELSIGVKNVVYFDYNSSAINNDSKLIVETQAEFLIKSNARNIVVAGYCDERGTREYNMSLGTKRAEALKDALVAQGVDASKIKVVSYGKDQPNPAYQRKMPEEEGYQDYLKHNRRSVLIIE